MLWRCWPMRSGPPRSSERSPTRRGSAEFRDLLSLARRGRPYNDETEATSLDALTLLRPIPLEAGRHLAGSGRLATASDVHFLEIDELIAMLSDSALPTPELDRRKAEYRWALANPAPDHLGPDPAPRTRVARRPRQVPIHGRCGAVGRNRRRGGPLRHRSGGLVPHASCSDPQLDGVRIRLREPSPSTSRCSRSTARRRRRTLSRRHRSTSCRGAYATSATWGWGAARAKRPEDQASCCSVHVLPSGSANPALRTPPPTSTTGATSTPRPRSTARPPSMSSTTRWSPFIVTASLDRAGRPRARTIEQAEPGGVNGTTRTPSAGTTSWSTVKPICSA